MRILLSKTDSTISMGSISKSFSLILVLILAASSLIMMAKPAFAVEISMRIENQSKQLT